MKDAASAVASSLGGTARSNANTEAGSRASKPSPSRTGGAPPDGRTEVQSGAAAVLGAGARAAGGGVISGPVALLRGCAARAEARVVLVGTRSPDDRRSPASPGTGRTPAPRD